MVTSRPNHLPSPMSAPRCGARSRTLLVLLGAAAVPLLASGCGNDPVEPGAGPATGLAVLGNDFAVTTVSLYDPAAGTVRDACVHSGTRSSGDFQTLSGDVTLPSQPQHGGELVAIDRKNAVLTFIDPVGCIPRKQISVSTGGFKANPHDLISISASKAYVTRYETNPDISADPSELDDGDDLLVIDPQAVDGEGKPVLKILKRIAMTSYASIVTDGAIQARPDRGVLAGGRVYVTLGNLNADFSAAGPGRVVVLDPATDTVTGSIDLPETQKGCSAITHDAASNRLYVACGGSFTDADQAAGSGLVQIDLAGTTPVATVAVTAGSVGAQSINFSSAVVIGDVAFVATLGARDFVANTLIAPDAFHAVPLQGGAATTLVEGSDAYNFGRVAVDPVRKLLFLPDGDAVAPRVHIFDVSVAPPASVGTFEANPNGHLPPREVAWY